MPSQRASVSGKERNRKAKCSNKFSLARRSRTSPAHFIRRNYKVGSGKLSRDLIREDLGVDIFQLEAAVDRRELQPRLESFDLGIDPTAVALLHETFDHRLVLCDQDIFAKRFELLVVLKLLTAVESGGRVGEDFNQDQGVQE